MSDPIDHPSHYTHSRIEPIDFIESLFASHPLARYSFHLGATIKYVSRAGMKDDSLQDLRKAQWYLSRVIQKLEEEKAK